jgi:hypothetical protein
MHVKYYNINEYRNAATNSGSWAFSLQPKGIFNNKQYGSAMTMCHIAGLNSSPSNVDFLSSNPRWSFKKDIIYSINFHKKLCQISSVLIKQRNSWPKSDKQMKILNIFNYPIF